MRLRKFNESQESDLDKYINACKFLGDNKEILMNEVDYLHNIFLDLKETYNIHMEAHKPGFDKGDYSIGMSLNPDTKDFGWDTWKHTKVEFIPKLMIALKRVYNRYPICSIRIIGSDSESWHLTMSKEMLNSDKLSTFNKIPEFLNKLSYGPRMVYVMVKFEDIINGHMSQYR